MQSLKHRGVAVYLYERDGIEGYVEGRIRKKGTDLFLKEKVQK